MVLDYLSIQIAVAILTTIAGVFCYTIGRYYYKDQSIKNLNDFLKTLDIDLVIEKLKFDSKFWKTAAVSMVASIVIVALIYAELIIQIVPNENIIVTAFKFFAVGVGMNFTINTLSSGGKLSTILQAIIAALLANDVANKPQGMQSKTQAVKSVLENNGVICREVTGSSTSTSISTPPTTVVAPTPIVEQSQTQPATENKPKA